MHQSELQPAVFRTSESTRSWHYLSLRWKIMLPLLAIVLVASMISAYLISDRIARGVERDERNQLLAASRAVSDRLAAFSAMQQHELDSIGSIPGLAANILAGDSTGLHPILEPTAADNNLALLLVYNAAAQEVIGLERDAANGTADYAVATATTDSGLAQAALDAETLQTTILLTQNGYMLASAQPLFVNGRPVAVIVVGTHINRALAVLRGGETSDLALFGPTSEFLGTTFELNTAMLKSLRLSRSMLEQTFDHPNEVTIERLRFQDTPYNVGYLPLVIHSTPLGVLAVYNEDSTLYATLLSRQTASFLAAGLVGLVMLAAFVVTNHFANRLERMTQVIYAISSGEDSARTGMHSADEIGALGAALDQLVEKHQHKTDTLQQSLREQRLETTRLNAILEAIPDGLIVQDLDGRVLLINAAAHRLLGGQRAFRSKGLKELTAVVTEKLGPALAPGIYALGDPTRIAIEGKMLQAQAAAITTKHQQQIGTVTILHDITTEVEREQTREALLDKLSEHAVAPTRLQKYESLTALAHEVAHNARTIQRVIAELRDLSAFEPHDLAAGQRALPLNDLLWNVAAEWQPVARKAHMRLLVRFGPRGLHILGDERRLRWALGNLIENALKYSPPGLAVNLEARVPDENPNSAEFIVRDTGYGISADDLPHVFTRFYRGTPCDPNGEPVRKPGTGQGLFIAQRVIEAHGGTISLESAIGVGTTVCVILPLTAPVTLEIPAGEEAEVELQSGGPFDTVPLEKTHQ